MRSWLVREVSTGPQVQSDDAMTVVDPELWVRGVHGLRAVDASVFPTLTSGNPGVTVMVVAERAAELILESHEDRASIKQM